MLVSWLVVFLSFSSGFFAGIGVAIYFIITKVKKKAKKSLNDFEDLLAGINLINDKK